MRVLAAIVTLALLLGGQVQAVSLDDSPRQIPTLEYWIESDLPPADSLSERVRQLRDIPGKKLEATRASFGYTSEAYWFRLNIQNPTPIPQERLLVIPVPQLDEIWFLEDTAMGLSEINRTGENYPFSHRLVPLPEYVFPVVIPAGENVAYLFRAQSDGSLIFPLKIWQERDYFLHENSRTMGRALYYGLLLFVILFNFFIYLTLRETVYLFYVLFIGSLLLIQATLHGNTFQYLWPDLHFLQNLVILLGVPFLVLAANEFSRRFLDVPTHSRWLNRWLLVLSALCLANVLSSLLIPAPLAKGSALVLALLTIMTLLMAGPYLWFRGVREARLFTGAWILLLLGSSLTALLELGVLPYSTFAAQGVQLGSAAEAIILSLAIVDRVYTERNERLRVQQQIITEQKERQQLEALRLHDAMHSTTSELPNRVYLHQQLRDQLRLNPEQSMRLVLVRINRYHDIDRTLGQDMADQLIYQLGIQINAFLGEDSEFLKLEQGTEGPVYLASLDESTLALILPEIDGEATSDVIRHLADYLLKRIQYGHLSLDLDPRLGTANYPHDAETVDGLIRAAKVALDSSRHIIGCISHYQRDTNPYSERRLTLMAELDLAIEENHLYLCFQPILDLQTYRVVSFEGLVRWRHPEHGEISPGEFIPLAEQTGNISKLTQWVLAEGLRHLKCLESEGFEDVGISLNLSAVDLEGHDFISHLDEQLARSGAPANRLTLELTETSMMKEPQLALSILSQIRQRGISVAMDDFGTGYSSLAYLRELPLNKIKIDRAFVHELAHSEDARVLIQTVVSMGHNLGYTLVAEGVETEAVALQLKELACHEMQGFWLGRPMLWEFAIEWLRAYVTDGGKERMQLLFSPEPNDTNALT